MFRHTLLPACLTFSSSLRTDLSVLASVMEEGSSDDTSE